MFFSFSLAENRFEILSLYCWPTIATLLSYFKPHLYIIMTVDTRPYGVALCVYCGFLLSHIGLCSRVIFFWISFTSIAKTIIRDYLWVCSRLNVWETCSKLVPHPSIFLQIMFIDYFSTFLLETTFHVRCASSHKICRMCR